jgi:hypothetical protein
MAMGHVGMSVDEGLRGDADAWQRGDRFLTNKKNKKNKKNKNAYFNKIEKSLDKPMEESVEKWLAKLVKMGFISYYRSNFR